ncbi:MAG: DUF962 domain-containing protein [Polyangiaceae bacterium]|nr:DUF962 domain-containing protein [Myxococcales bacterium]MCB9586266.1 DUF962 domain-containing protein [Polyangiaceae bacterium]MCB9606943.1 DUF962 domain-containing protein [Polyangiaceae bacterium]
MKKLKLNAEWTALMDSYRDDHQNETNQFCHTIGIPMIAASFPVGATVVGLPLAASMFTVGWGFQFVGHYFEGKPPSFVSDKRSLVIGLLWWAKKVGIDVVEETRPENDTTEAPRYESAASAAE